MPRAASVVLLLVTAVAPASAGVRAHRRILVGLSLPDGLAIANHDRTIPLPALHLGYQVRESLLLEGAASYLPLRDDASMAIAHVGARYLFTTSRLAPYAFARAGVYAAYPDEGDRGNFPFVVAGGGLDLALAGGFAAWLEAGPGVASVNSTTELALYVSAGAGYRF